jgi:addiction module HigA family antidote
MSSNENPIALDGNVARYGARAALARIPKRKRPEHPGRILLEDYLLTFQISQNALARSMGVHPRVVNRICSGQRPITAPIAIRLGAVLYMPASFWMGLQAEYDIYRLENRVLSTLPNRSTRPAPQEFLDDFIKIDF